MEIVEIEIQTDNILDTEIFYSELLMLPISFKNEHRISFKVGSSVLTFVQSSLLNPKYHFAFNIPCNKLDEAIFWLEHKLELIKNEELEIISNFESWNAKAIYFYDNNGNILEFIARFDLNNHSNKEFDSNAILSINEIGIVTSDPKIFAEMHHEKYNIPYFSKGTQSNKFSILGNDCGLLIIVESHRVWYPTDLKAEKFYTKIKFLQDGVLHKFFLN